MERRTLVRPALFAVLVLMATSPACMAGTLTEEEAFTRTLPVTSQTALEVRNTNGYIHVTGWDRHEIRVEAIKKAADRATLRQIRIDIQRTPDAYRIEVRLPQRRGIFRWGPAASVAFDLKVPRTMAVDLDSTNGGLRVSGMQAPARLETTNGAIEVHAVQGDVVARTTNGSLQVTDVVGRVDTKTTNGKVTLTNVTGCARARSTNGAIEAQLEIQDPCDRLSFGTTNGSIYLQIGPAALRRIEARAANGRIRIRLPARTVEIEKRRRVEVDLGPTGALLELRTTNGSITVEQGP